jgi:hypothetical protein
MLKLLGWSRPSFECEAESGDGTGLSPPISEAFDSSSCEQCGDESYEPCGDESAAMILGVMRVRVGC